MFTHPLNAARVLRGLRAEDTARVFRGFEASFIASTATFRATLITIHSSNNL
ncbi:hypothetical protein PGB90_002209 [Kerria lacca]